MKHFASLSGYGITRARKLMKEYVAQGVMEHVPLSRGYYRPTKGNFGREYTKPIDTIFIAKRKIYTFIVIIH